MENQPLRPQNRESPYPQKKGSLKEADSNKIVIGLIAILVVAILVISLASAANSKQVKIVVKCTGSWSGVYGDQGGMNTWIGSGEKTV